MDSNKTMEEFGPPTALDIVLPPAIGCVFLTLALLLLSFFTQPAWWRNLCCPSTLSTRRRIRSQSHHDLEMTSSVSGTMASPHDATLFSTQDLITIRQFNMFQNNPWSLLKLGAPALISVIFCPITIFLQPKMLDFFYPNYMGGRRNINDSVSVFLLPAGLVYAMAFGFALQDALVKLDVTTANVQRHLTLLRQCQQLVGCGDSMMSQQKARMFRHLCSCTTHWMRSQMHSKHSYAYGADVWHMITEIQVCRKESSADETVYEALFDKILQIDSLMAEGYRGARANINALQWVFMEMLGFIAFFGILLIVTDSYRLELTMCILTVFTISAFVYILADLDYAYHGTFIVDLSVFVMFLEELDDQFATLTKDFKQNGKTTSFTKTTE